MTCGRPKRLSNTAVGGSCPECKKAKRLEEYYKSPEYQKYLQDLEVWKSNRVLVAVDVGSDAIVRLCDLRKDLIETWVWQKGETARLKVFGKHGQYVGIRYGDYTGRSDTFGHLFDNLRRSL